MANFDFGLPDDEAPPGPRPGEINDSISAPPEVKQQARQPQQQGHNFDFGLPSDQDRPKEAPHVVESGSFLPISRNSDGSINWFDSNAGIVGSVKHALADLPSLAHQVGQETLANTATPQTAGRVLDLAMMAGPGDLMPSEGIGANLVKTIPPKPTSPMLHEAADWQYAVGRSLPGYYTENGLANLASRAKQDLYDQGFDETQSSAPGVHAALSRLGDPRSVIPGAPVDPNATIGIPIAWVDNQRRVLSQIARNQHTVEGAAASAALPHIETFLANPTKDDVLYGPVDQAAQLYRLGGQNYGAARRSDLLNGVEEGADYRASANNSGANYDNTLRQRLQPYVDPSVRSKQLTGFNPEEKAATAKLVEGTWPRNLLRRASNMTGGGGGWGGAVEGLLAAHEVGPAGMAVPFVGAGLRAAQNALARRQFNKVDELIRSRSPLYQEQAANAPFELRANAPGIATVRAAEQSGINDQQQPYAKGGKVKPTHEYLVARLMRLAEEAKRAQKKSTEPILKVDDNTVATALEKAKAAI